VVCGREAREGRKRESVCEQVVVNEKAIVHTRKREDKWAVEKTFALDQREKLRRERWRGFRFSAGKELAMASPLDQTQDTGRKGEDGRKEREKTSVCANSPRA
jgi:hypothetical protein